MDNNFSDGHHNIENEKDDDVRIVRARGIGADQRPDQDHGRAGGTDDAGEEGAEGEDGEIGARRAAQVTGHEDAAGNRVKREQQHDET